MLKKKRQSQEMEQLQAVTSEESYSEGVPRR